MTVAVLTFVVTMLLANLLYAWLAWRFPAAFDTKRIWAAKPPWYTKIPLLLLTPGMKLGRAMARCEYAWLRRRTR